jgi:hypothetical protein
MAEDKNPDLGRPSIAISDGSMTCKVDRNTDIFVKRENKAPSITSATHENFTNEHSKYRRVLGGRKFHLSGAYLKSASRHGLPQIQGSPLFDLAESKKEPASEEFPDYKPMPLRI